MNFIFDPSLVLYLPLYELDVASFQSKDASGHLCTVTGALWRPNGRYFDGTDDKIDVGTVSLFNFTSSAFTIEAWLYISGLTASGNIFCRGLYETDGYRLFYNAAGRLRFDTSQSGANQRTDANEGRITANIWQHLVATRDGASIKLYRNIVDITDSPGSHQNPVTSTRNAYIGQNDGGGEFVKGTIGEVRIYSRALTPLEIQHIYLATKWRYR